MIMNYLINLNYFFKTIFQKTAYQRCVFMGNKIDIIIKE
ncbi:hypothetical protein SAMN06298216_1479 [Spirosomataceae bacterium TFI 002]|nr:hypothetical protein SAMN06298216_1479 [Spirosomataceae bacterium TFI 002]